MTIVKLSSSSDRFDGVSSSSRSETAIQRRVVDPIIFEQRKSQRVRVVGDSLLARRIRSILKESAIGWIGGNSVADRRVAPTFNVLVGLTQPPILTARAHQRRGLSHLAVNITAAGVEIGPIVVPGSTPCLHCVERHRCDDPSWRDRDPNAWIDAPLMAMAAATTAAILHHYFDTGQSAAEVIRLSGPMTIRRYPRTFDPGCDCASTRLVSPPQRLTTGQSSKPMAKVDSRSCRE